ncbi:hypothetical protein ACOSP7_026540 [Xanthoceras sorbifolium]
MGGALIPFMFLKKNKKESWGAVDLLVPPSISCLKPLELLECAERACDLPLRGSDWGVLPRSTSNSERRCWSLRIGWFGATVVCDLGAATIGLDCSGVERSLSDLVGCAGCCGLVVVRWAVRAVVVLWCCGLVWPIWAVRGLGDLWCCGLVCCGLVCVWE